MNTKILIIMAFSGASILLGCNSRSEPIETSALIETIQNDRAVIYQKPEISQGLNEKLRIEDALALAIKYNLDTKVSEMDELIAADDVDLQMLSALPTVTTNLQRQGRNNRGGSSSFSLLTNSESLEPSISQEQYRNVVQLTTEWNLLDAGINLWRGKSVSDQLLIAQERRRKIYQSVVQDTYIAYWRAAIAQRFLPEIDQMMSQISEAIEDTDRKVEQGVVAVGDAQAEKAELIEKQMQLSRTQSGLQLADLELKTLIAYPLDANLTLDLEDWDPSSITTLPSVETSIDGLEKIALINRPELREEFLNKRISTRDIKLSIAETIPGLELLFTYNYDSNKFLAFNNWIDGIAGITSSINQIITAPSRYKRAQNADLLSDKRRQALTAAIITQVHISRARYDSLSKEYKKHFEKIAHGENVLKRAVDYNSVGLMSESELALVKIDTNIDKINKAFAYADAQDAYARFINTLGIDFWDQESPDLSIQEYANRIKNNFYNVEAFNVSQAQDNEVLQ
ncbi:MAG: TolC family protein [Pseudomonadota bacterium]